METVLKESKLFVYHTFWFVIPATRRPVTMILVLIPLEDQDCQVSLPLGTPYETYPSAPDEQPSTRNNRSLQINPGNPTYPNSPVQYKC
eukprot:1553475-Amphidinium_carterae.1